MDKLTVPINTAAAALGISRASVYNLINSNALETVAIGRRRLVRVESIRRLAGEAA